MRLRAQESTAAASESQRSDDRALVDRFLRRRSEESFRALYQAHTPYLYAIALRYNGGDPADAEEAVQETWIRAAERLDRFGWRSALRTWLAGITLNCARELQRRGHRRQAREAAFASPQQLPRSAHGDPAQAVDLARRLAGLPDAQRAVLALFLAGFTHAEIGSALGIAAGTSKSRLFQARRLLRAEVENMTEGGDRR